MPGSLYEAQVPFILSEPLNEVYAQNAEGRRIASREIFDFAINGTQ